MTLSWISLAASVLEVLGKLSAEVTTSNGASSNERASGRAGELRENQPIDDI